MSTAQNPVLPGTSIPSPEPPLPEDQAVAGGTDVADRWYRVVWSSKKARVGIVVVALEIVAEFESLLARDGFATVADAVGADVA